VRIYREEIWLEVKRENEAAAQASGASLPAHLPAPHKTDGGDKRATKVNPTPPRQS
jgi:hypothetical protein